MLTFIQHKMCLNEIILSLNSIHLLQFNVIVNKVETKRHFENIL